MTIPSPSAGLARRTLRALTLVSGALLVIWATGSYFDLNDGETWERARSCHLIFDEGAGLKLNEYGFCRVSGASHPNEFKYIVVMRGLVPIVFLGILFGVCAIGWSAQPRQTVCPPER